MHSRGHGYDGFEFSEGIVSCVFRHPLQCNADYFCSCFVRARRLNVIIQPHLKFVYELMKWDELQQEKRGEQIKRELDWPVVAREIAAMNRPYSRG